MAFAADSEMLMVQRLTVLHEYVIRTSLLGKSISTSSLRRRFIRVLSTYEKIHIVI